MYKLNKYILKTERFWNYERKEWVDPVHDSFLGNNKASQVLEISIYAVYLQNLSN